MAKFKIHYDQIFYFLAFLGLAIIKNRTLYKADPYDWSIEIILTFLFALICLMLRANMQLFAAHLSGDINIKIQKKFSFFSFAFIDWIGLIPLVAFQMGWGRPLASDKAYKGTKIMERVLIIASGPVCTIILSLLLKLCVRPLENLSLSLAAVAELFARVSLHFGLIQLLPIPPFDGWYILGALLKRNVKVNDGKNYGLMLLLILYSYGLIQALILTLAASIMRLF